MTARGTWQQVLMFLPEVVSRAKVRRCYERYCFEQGLPRRCDSELCVFHAGELTWNGAPLPLTLDHVNGVSRDNRPGNLRFLCPNCDAQQPTRGGLNKGRVQVSSGGFAIKRSDGKRDYTLVAQSGTYRIGGADAVVRREATRVESRRTKR